MEFILRVNLSIHFYKERAKDLREVQEQTTRTLAVESEQKVCQDYLDGLAGTLSDLKVQTVVRITSAVQGILEQAEEHDLVVVASHGLGGFERWLLGSVTEKVLHLVKSPLLIVHTQETD